ncbi:hypothetical protein [Zavarzinella formosa]|uniref:hypothetical protein n=1 Tax=Zavarzinella formosa TaxID=360055 RepID=UPI0002E305E5|nr:hypothetical protein [Zavarzinella formosa]
MIRLMAVVAMCGVLQLGIGCRHVGGECDCAAVPGDSVGINPHKPGYGETTHVAPAMLPAMTVVPPATTNFEPIAPPKTIPPGR